MYLGAFARHAQLTSHGTIAPLSAARKTQMMTRFGQNGLRMLALAYRDLSLPSHAVRLATPYTVEVGAPGYDGACHTSS